MRELVEPVVDERNESIARAFVPCGPLAQETADVGGGRCDPALQDWATRPR
jgi:hypothetical protein